jgi:hypothetical protein
MSTEQTSRNDMDYDSFEEDDDEVLLDQGLSVDEITVEDGEIFEIEEGYTGTFSEDDETEYYWGNPDNVDSIKFDSHAPIEGYLEAGRYRLEGNRIYIIEEYDY